MPGDHSSAWEFLFPTHDYPMPTAMATLECATLGPGTGTPGDAAETSFYAASARRWADAAVAESETWPSTQVRYAEHYARLIVYLARYAETTGEADYRRAAESLAHQAAQQLDRGSLMVGRTNATWYDAIDGVGYLLLAFLYLETGEAQALALF